MTAPAQERARPGRLGPAVEGLIVVAAGAMVWLAARQLPDALVDGQPAPGAWPATLAATLAGLGVLLLVFALAGRTRPGDAEPVQRSRWPVLVGAGAALPGLVIGWSLVGYLPTALVLIPVLARVLGVGTWRRCALVGVGLALLTWGLFGQLLGIAL